MTSMIERVARAMCRADNGDGYEARWEFYKALATAAIEAMRKPTGAMVEALYHEDNDGEVEHAYSRAIDAALNEQVAG